MKKKIQWILILVILIYNIVYLPWDYFLGCADLQFRPWVGQLLYWVDALVIAWGILWMSFSIARSAKSSDSTVESTVIGAGVIGLLAALLIYLFFAFFFYAFLLNPKKEGVAWSDGKKYVSCEWSEGLEPAQCTLYEYHGWFVMGKNHGVKGSDTWHK